MFKLEFAHKLRSVRAIGLAAALIAGTLALASPPAAAATDLVADIFPGGVGSSPQALTNVNGTLLFTADDGTHGRELWTNDCTPPCTQLVKDINPGAAGSIFGGFTVANGKLFFSANNGTDGTELWKSDGTAAGTVLVKDINPGGAGSPSTAGSNPESLTDVNGTLFFTASDGTNGRELWKSDGTEHGTVVVWGLGGTDTAHLTNVNGTLFFTANDGMTGIELWKTDGTELGTVLVKNINPGTAGSPGNTASSNPESLTNVNGTLFFTANDGTNGQELWTSDGSEGGTVRVLSPDYDLDGIADLTNVNGTLFFTATDGTNGQELWKSNGTEAGTALVKDVNPGPPSSDIHAITATYMGSGNFLVFTANDGLNGTELWKSDGTAAGTLLVEDINPGPPSSIDTGKITYTGLEIMFTANDGLNGPELWKSDGTADGTVLLSDINPGRAGSDPQGLSDVNGTLFFSANNGTDGAELWKSDGVAESPTPSPSPSPSVSESPSPEPSPSPSPSPSPDPSPAQRFLVVGPGEGMAPRVKLLDADNGKTLLSFLAFERKFQGGVTVALGDVNADGHPDIIVGAGPGHRPLVKVFDTNGIELDSFLAYPQSFRGGVFVAGGDVNGDGFADIITGPGQGMAPLLKIFDRWGNNKSADEYLSFLAYGRNFEGGVHVACCVGDLNGDGRDEIITGAGPGSAGPRVKVFDANNGNLLDSFLAYPKSFLGGVSVAAGDLNGDGVADLMTGPGQGTTPLVKIFDRWGNSPKNEGSDKPLLRFLAYDDNFRGGVHVAFGDVNGDGLPDAITGPGQGGIPRVKAFDGEDLASRRGGFIIPAIALVARPYDKDFRGGVKIADNAHPLPVNR